MTVAPLMESLEPGGLPQGPSGDRLLRAVIEWDIGTWARCLPFWAPVLAGQPAGSLVLVLGDRSGGLSLWFALQGFRVICSDRYGSMKGAQQLHREYGVQSRIQYAYVNAFSVPFSDDSLAIVAAKSVIGGLKIDRTNPMTWTMPAKRLAMREIQRVLKPGGHFLGAENMAGSRAHRIGRRWLRGERIGWHYFTVADLEGLLESFSSAQLQYFGWIGTHWRYAVLNRLSATLDRAICPVLPASAKYVAFIRARK